MSSIDDGSISRKMHVKSANKGFMLNSYSHQPTAMKRSTVLNEQRRADRNSTSEHSLEAQVFINKKLRRNGYPNSWQRTTTKTNKKTPKPSYNFVYKIPFVSDAFNRGVNRILQKHNIPARLTNHRHKNIQALTKRTSLTQPTTCKSESCAVDRRCQEQFVVYKATCRLCGSTYIGQTTRTLHDRAREHVLSAKKKDTVSALGIHYREKHPQHHMPSIAFTIIERAGNNELRLKIKEALAIKVSRPDLNRRIEDMGTGYLP